MTVGVKLSVSCKDGNSVGVGNAILVSSREGNAITSVGVTSTEPVGKPIVSIIEGIRLPVIKYWKRTHKCRALV
jgi:hypothetical protein